MIKLGIVGGRDYNDYENFKKLVDEYIDSIGQPSEIISGGALGVDTMAEKYANDHSIAMTIFKPDWNHYGKSAGIRRNTDIINQSTHILALPTKKSVGTHDSIRKAEKANRILKVINV